MIDESRIRGVQQQAEKWAFAAGVGYARLTEDEISQMALSLNRILKYTYPERVHTELFEDHLGEIVAGAMIAKEQMKGQNIDGEMPESGKIGGPIPIRAAYLGLGDDWTDIVGITGGTEYFTTGSPVNWIHSGTTMLGGTAGNAVKIGSNAVHVILAITSLHESPKLESIRFEINEKPYPVLYTGWTFENPRTLPIKELESAILLSEGDTVKAELFFSSAYGNSVSYVVDYPALIGVSYIKEAQLRIHDPAELDGTVQDVILTT